MTRDLLIAVMLVAPVVVEFVIWSMGELPRLDIRPAMRRPPWR